MTQPLELFITLKDYFTETLTVLPLTRTRTTSALRALIAVTFAAALAMKKYLEENPGKGTVVLFGCPSEEKGNGKTIMARDGISAEYAQSRIAAQHPDIWFRERCDWILENNGTQMQFQEKCIAFLHHLGIMKENQ